MSEIVRTLNMRFNNEFVGKVHLWDDGEVTAHFEENETGALCVAFLVQHALQGLLLKSGFVIGEFEVNLN